jgi:peroxiredoxin Q/BCP
MLKPGTPAPAIEAPDSDGTAFSLSAALESGPVVLYFFPKAFTAG